MAKKKKQKGGYLSGPKHKDGGMPAIIAGKEPVELEGGEYIIKASTVDAVGKENMDTFNKTGKLPQMKKGGKVKHKNDDDVTTRKSHSKRWNPKKHPFKEKRFNKGKESFKMLHPDETDKMSDEEFKGYLKHKEKYGKDSYKKYKKERKRVKISNIKTKLKNKLQKKKQMGGAIKPYASVPAQRFPKDVRMMGHGGQVSTSNDKAGAGDIHTTHTHSGYKAGE